MNSLANFTTIFSHNEPILSLPDSGSCSLLTGIEKANITSNVFQPCCSSAAPVGFERSTCKAESGWETCFAQHRQDFKLVAAVCSSSGGRRVVISKAELGFAFVVMFGILTVQSGF